MHRVGCSLSRDAAIETPMHIEKFRGLQWERSRFIFFFPHELAGVSLDKIYSVVSPPLSGPVILWGGHVHWEGPFSLLAAISGGPGENDTKV